MKALFLHITLLPFCFFILQDSFCQIITTIAGTGVAGYSGDGGAGTNARLTSCTGIVFDLDGNLLITDQQNNVVRKLDTKTNIITTIAGTGIAGYSGDGGLAINAMLNWPTGIDVDRFGNIYIAEQQSFVIRKIDAVTGIITTVAGTNTAGVCCNGTPALTAQLSRITDVNVDDIGNIYIADWENSLIRKVDKATGLINIVAGIEGDFGYNGSSGIATQMPLNNPPRITFDKNGDLVFCEELIGVIRRITLSTGAMNDIAGRVGFAYTGDGGPATAARFERPTGTAYDASGNLYIADSYNYVIRKIDGATNIITTIAGNGTEGYSGDGGAALNATFTRMTDLTFDKEGNLYIADARANVIRKITFCKKTGTNKTADDLCSGSTIQLSPPNNTGTWASSNQTIATVNNNGKVDARSAGTINLYYTYTDQGCIIIDTTQLKVVASPNLFLGNDTSICNTKPLLINAADNFTKYQWNNGSSSSNITVVAVGEYWVTVTAANLCTITDTIFIKDVFNGRYPQSLMQHLIVMELRLYF